MPTWQCSTRVELLLCDNVQFSLAFTRVLMGGEHGLVLQTHDCELELPFVPLLKGKQVSW